MPETRPIRMRLSEVRLERFKAAFKPAGPIVFHPFNAIIGRNGAGKSTVLEALQLIDSALRTNIRAACGRYNGIHDLINLRSSTRPRSFKIGLFWDSIDDPRSSAEYWLKVGEMGDGRIALILEETLILTINSDRYVLITTDKHGGRRLQFPPNEDLAPFAYRENLLLGTVLAREADDLLGKHLRALRDFWTWSVFLRLSPNELAKTAAPERASSEPLLNETGRSLPTLLRELKREQIDDLIYAIQQALPDFNDVEVSRPLIPQGEIYYSLTETMPSRGKTGRKSVEVPSWMLSEGTRRITAILAVIQHVPAPTFLCIEEIENGLDPWTVVEVIKQLKSAADRGIQVAFTTHSPWLLDHVEFDDIILVERKRGETVYSRFADKDEVKAYKGRVPPGAVYATEG